MRRQQYGYRTESAVSFEMPAPVRRRLRFSVRALMTLVAVVAVTIFAIRSAIELSPSVRKYRAMAQWHGVCLQEWRERSRLAENGWSLFEQDPTLMLLEAPQPPPPYRLMGQAAVEEAQRRASVATLCRSMAAFHDEMRQKWLRAASRPWEAVSREPIPPFYVQHRDTWSGSY
jgi:hypothetical protein